MRRPSTKRPRAQSMSLELSTAPTSEPVTLAELKDHLRIERDEHVDDLLLAGYLKAARQYIEKAQGRQHMTATWKRYLSGGFYAPEIELPYAPLQSVTSIQYIDTNGDTQTLSTSVYSVDTKATPGRVYLAYNQAWPSTRGIINDVTITYVAGYTAASLVPSTIKSAVMLLAAHLYNVREPVTVGVSSSVVPFGLQMLIEIDRVPEVP